MLIPQQLPVFPMSQLHHLITIVTNRIMKISGCPINRMQFIIIREIHSKNGLSQTSLARLIGMDRNNLSRVCAELETRGLIQRKVREEDRRHYTLELTDYGRPSTCGATRPWKTTGSLLAVITRLKNGALSRTPCRDFS